MDLDNDLFALPPFIKGLLVASFVMVMISGVMTIGIVFWESRHPDKCGGDKTYFKKENVCVDNSVLTKPGG